MNEELQKQGLADSFSPCQSHWNIPQKLQPALQPFDLLLGRFCETLIPWRVLSRLSAMQYILRLEISLMGPTRALNAPHEYMRGEYSS